MERWRDDATTMTERMERSEIVREYSANLSELRRAVATLERLQNNRALLQEHATHEQQKMGEVLEERGGRWVPKPSQEAEE